MKEGKRSLWIDGAVLGHCLLAAAGILLWKAPEAAPVMATVSTTVAETTRETTVPSTTVPVETTLPMSQAELAIQTFATENAISPDVYPESLVALLERNPETEEFVLNYPLEYGQTPEVDLSGYEDLETVPLFMQWDRQWGYMDYGSDVAGLTACGPVCLSMAAYYLTGDEAMSPDNIIRFAIDNGYCVPGNGSYWSLIDQGGSQLGLDVTAVSIEKEVAIANLEVGNPIICIMGPGDFTTSGHFILLAGVEDGLIRVNDPNSYANSERLWEFDDIADQIEGMWVLRYFG